MEFICTTQGNHLNTYTGPSGEAYLSMYGHPFKVKNKLDIEFFKDNVRFKKIGILSPAPAPEAIMDVDEELETIVYELKGVTKSTAKKLADLFLSIEKLKDAVENGEKLYSIPRKQAKIIIDWIMER